MAKFLDINFSVINLLDTRHFKEALGNFQLDDTASSKIMYVSSGSFDCSCAQNIQAGTFLFIPSGISFSLQIKEPLNAYLISFEAIYFGQTDAVTAEFFCYRLKNPSKLKRLFVSAHNRFAEGGAYCYTRCKGQLYEIILQVKTDYAGLFPSEYKAIRLDPAFRYIQENFRKQNIDISHLAQLCGMSEAYFRANFKKAAGCTPKNYINSLKIQYAAELIDQKMYNNLEEVAAAAGFNDLSYFSRVFLKINGLRPSVYAKTTEQ